ncbi:UDP-glucuronosyl and UDP-glucosyl transferase [Handroanthus impetiginosus]|uniref:UDP-glucuronosyl and UDP-glucosyl transferase n=1 Tax=Handroanthus impetiginosus TaxID=429701 RepID=A0A2G9GL56_9LAMI|nr:UDP-glucuronosyl and UDP-glucosyl transferase [Handroanthus impetiginosus]
MGYLTSFLHISNKLAERGHRIFFTLPSKTQSKVQQFNLHSILITFIPIAIPQIEGLPNGTETTSDIPFPLYRNLRRAMDLTEPAIEGYLFCDEASPDALMEPAPGFPSSEIKLYKHEARVICEINNDKEFGINVKFVERLIMTTDECDAIGFKSCREIEGAYCKFLEKKLKKKIILAGPVLPVPPISSLDEKWKKWLDQFKPKSVIYCAFGSEARLKTDQFQELLLGFELTGLPFLAVPKPPIGAKAEEALPEGFAERTAKRGVVYGGWVQQQLILSHSSVGCFMTHCGSGSLSEAMVNECQLVLMSHVDDQIINTRLMGGDLRVGVEVEKGDEDGLFTKEGVMKAVKLVMDGDSEIGREVAANHGKWRDFLLKKGLEDCYIGDFVQNLGSLLE